MARFPPKLQEILKNDTRYTVEAYAFVSDAYRYALKMLGLLPKKAEEARPVHVTARQLCEGARALAQREYGLMARSVLARWGIRTTDDVGNVVFNLIAAGVMHQSAEDDRADFSNVFDLADALERDYEMKFEETE